MMSTLKTRGFTFSLLVDMMKLVLCLAVVTVPSAVSGAFVVSSSRAAHHPNKNDDRPFNTISGRATIDESDNANTQKEWDVQRYQDQHSFVWQYGSSLVEMLKPRAGERILDVGCGSGELTAAIASMGDSIQVTGMDNDRSMVERALEQFPHLTFFQGNVCNFSLGMDKDDDQLFDAIFSNAALHWVPSDKVEHSVMAMSNALKVGGRFVVEFGGKGNVQHIVEATMEEFPDSTSPWYFPSISEYSSLLEKHGIEVLSAALYDRPTPLEDEQDGLKNWLKMFGRSFFENMKNDEEMDAALDRIQDKLRPLLYDYDQYRWMADYRRIRIIGKKITVT